MCYYTTNLNKTVKEYLLSFLVLSLDGVPVDGPVVDLFLDDLGRLGVSEKVVDQVSTFLDAFLRRSGQLDVHDDALLSFVRNVDPAAGLLREVVDGGTVAADQLADVIRRDLSGQSGGGRHFSFNSVF